MDIRLRSIHAQNTGRNRAGGTAAPQPGRYEPGQGSDPPRRLDRCRRSATGAQDRCPSSSAGLGSACAHWTPVHIHLGASETTGRVAVLGDKGIVPGEDGLVQLVLDQAIGAVRGDGLIIRNQSAQRTIGGGQVIDVYSPTRGRAKPERIAFLRAMEEPDDGTALSALLENSPHGLCLEQFAGARNLASGDMEALSELVPMKAVSIETGTLGFSAQHWETVRTAVLDGSPLAKKSPDTVGPGENRILCGTGIRLPTNAALGISAELRERHRKGRHGYSFAVASAEATRCRRH